MLIGVSEASAWLIYPYGNWATNLGYGLGTAIAALLFALIIAGIRRIFTKNGFSLTVVQSWGALLVLISIMNYHDRPPLVPDHQTEVHAAAQNLGAAVTTTRTPPTTNAPQSAETDSQALARVMNQLADSLRSYKNSTQRIMADENSLPLGMVLAPASLTSADGIANGRHTLAHYGSDNDQLQNIFASYFAEARRIIDSAPSGLREQIRGGYDKTNPRTHQVINDYFTAERNIIATSNAILDLGERNLGVSYAKGAQIYLPSGALEQYQSLMKQLTGEAAQDEHARKAVAASQQKAADEIKSLVSETTPTSTP